MATEYDSYVPHSLICSNFLHSIKDAFDEIASEYIMTPQRGVFLDACYYCVKSSTAMTAADFDEIYAIMKYTYFSAETQSRIFSKWSDAIALFLRDDTYLEQMAQENLARPMKCLLGSPNIDPEFWHVLQECGVHRFMMRNDKPQFSLSGIHSEEEFLQKFEASWQQDPLPVITKSAKGFSYQRVKRMLVYKQRPEKVAVDQ